MRARHQRGGAGVMRPVPDAAPGAPVRTVPVALQPDAAACDAAVEALMTRAFGPGRHAKAASHARESASLRRELSHVALDADGRVVGACRLWRVVDSIGHNGLLLGPIAVLPDVRGLGLGHRLAAACLAASDAAGADPVLLVGAPGFFAPLGFKPVPPGAARLHWPFDPTRLLLRPGGDGSGLAGLVSGFRAAL